MLEFIGIWYISTITTLTKNEMKKYNLHSSNGILEFLTELIENFTIYFTKKLTSLGDSYIVIHSKKLIQLFDDNHIRPRNINNVLMYNLINWNGIFVRLKIYLSSSTFSKKKFEFSIDFLKYYRSYDFLLLKVESDKDYICIIKKLFQLNHLLQNEDFHSYNRKINSTFIRCYLEYIFYVFNYYKSKYDNHYIILVSKNENFLYEREVITENIDSLKEEIRNQFPTSDKIEFSIRKKLEYFTEEDLYSYMIINEEDSDIIKYYDFLKSFSIKLHIVQTKLLSKEELLTHKKLLQYIIFTISKIDYPFNSKTIRIYENIIECIEDIKKNSLLSSFPLEYKEIFSPLIKDRRFVSVKAIL